MKDYIVKFEVLGLQQKEKVTAENLFKAEKIIKEKYREGKVRISSVVSTVTSNDVTMR